MSTSADIIAKRLARAGIRHAFGIPGGEVLTVIDALRDNGIEFTLVKHENSGGFMAEGAYQASDTPALLVATIGPGVSNAVNFIANAQQDRVPVIYITGCVDEAEAMRYTHQVFDHRAVLAPITKASMRVPDGAVEETIDKALSIALDEPMGPVHVDVPIGVATAMQAERPPIIRCRPSYGIPDAATIHAIEQQLQSARRPIAIAGVGVLQQHAEAALAGFLRAHSIPLVTTYKSKGILPEEDPLCLGASGLSPRSAEILQPLIRQADLVLLFGYDPIEMRSAWRNVWDTEKVTVLEFGTLVNTHYMHQSSAHYYCDLKVTLAAIDAPHPGHEYWPGGEIPVTREAHAAAFASPREWGPHQIIATTQAALPENTVVTADTGAHRILLSQMWRCIKTRTLLQSNGLSTMGVAVPMALGYKMVRPELPVVAFTGDAGMEMVMGELGTVRDSGLAIIIVIFVDESLALIELKQRAMGYPNTAVDFATTDFVTIGRAYGFHSAWVDDAQTLDAELKQALDRKQQTTLLACRLPRQAYSGAF